MRYEYERHVAMEAVIKACHLCEAIRRRDWAGEKMEKDDRSPVTVADFSAQAVISLELMRAFPDDPVTAEENLNKVRADVKEKIGSSVHSVFPELTGEQIFAAIDRGNYDGGPAGRYWALDPVDGTKGFLRGEQYAIALALIENGEVKVGVLGCPNLPFALDLPGGGKGSIFVAIKGQGARMRLIENPSEKVIQVAQANDPVEASFCESVEPGHSSHQDSHRIAKILGIRKPPVRIDSQCKYGIVARGDASIYLRLPGKSGYQEKVWDHAAGWLIVKEAGGEVTDIYGHSLDFSTGRVLSRNTGIVATNGKLHHQVLSAIRKIVAVK